MYVTIDKKKKKKEVYFCIKFLTYWDQKKQQGHKTTWIIVKVIYFVLFKLVNIFSLLLLLMQRSFEVHSWSDKMNWKNKNY
jgi:hypothetical protein